MDNLWHKWSRWCISWNRLISLNPLFLNIHISLIQNQCFRRLDCLLVLLVNFKIDQVSTVSCTCIHALNLIPKTYRFAPNELLAAMAAIIRHHAFVIAQLFGRSKVLLKITFHQGHQWPKLPHLVRRIWLPIVCKMHNSHYLDESITSHWLVNAFITNVSGTLPIETLTW